MRTLAGCGTSVLTLLLVVAAAHGHSERSDAGSRAVAAAAPPSHLADGSRPAPLPPAIRRFGRRPVVGAKRVRTEAPRTYCRREPGERFVTAWLSPEGLSVISSAPRLPGPHACDLVRVRGRWRACSSRIAHFRDPRRVERSGGALGVCTPAGRWRAFMWIASSSRSAWVLVERRGFWVAYRTSGAHLIRISGTERPSRADRFRTTVVFLDARGRVVERRRVVGAVAG